MWSLSACDQLITTPLDTESSTGRRKEALYLTRQLCSDPFPFTRSRVAGFRVTTPVDCGVGSRANTLGQILQLVAGGVRAERDRSLARVRDLPARRLARADGRQGRQTAAGTAEEASDTVAADASADAKGFSSYTVYTLYSIVNEYTERTRG